MSPVLPKHQMSEEDIKLQYITPSITSKWSRDKITMETRITDGKINLKGNFVFREKPKRADYILYLSANNPIAVVEAKDNTYSVSHGLACIVVASVLDYVRVRHRPRGYRILESLVCLHHGDAYRRNPFRSDADVPSALLICGFIFYGDRPVSVSGFRCGRHPVHLGSYGPGGIRGDVDFEGSRSSRYGPLAYAGLYGRPVILFFCIVLAAAAAAAGHGDKRQPDENVVSPFHADCLLFDVSLTNCSVSIEKFFRPSG